VYLFVLWGCYCFVPADNYSDSFDYTDSGCSSTEHLRSCLSSSFGSEPWTAGTAEAVAAHGRGVGTLVPTVKKFDLG